MSVLHLFCLIPRYAKIPFLFDTLVCKNGKKREYIISEMAMIFSRLGAPHERKDILVGAEFMRRTSKGNL